MICFLASGCSTITRTSYKPFSIFDGYSDLKISDDLRVARFVGSPHTNRQEIAALSGFRAIEICRSENFLLADIYETRIPSKGGALNPSYRPYVDTQDDFTGYAYVPYDSYFACRNELHILGIALKPVKPEEVNTYVNDGKGALRAEGFVALAPNQDRLKVDDLILELNGKRVSNTAEAKAAIATASDMDQIPAKIVSNKQISLMKLKAASVTTHAVAAQDAIVKAVCKNYPGASESLICREK
ncbi:MAG: hypothetical protein NDJ89_08775 [Oligoflexia bacterium]|nr:hypothetical protein [Oligoflexia bacterium]